MFSIRHTIPIFALLALTACNQSPKPAQNNTETPQPTASQTAPTPADDAISKLLATAMNNGFLLTIRQHPSLDEKQKNCLADFDKSQTLTLAKDLISKNLTADDIAEANDFYQQPIGQKLITFNQEQAEILQDTTGKTALKQANFSDDEQLQFGAFVATNAGQKIQQIVRHELQSTIAPIEQAQLQKCQISVETFHQTPKTQ